ncbi:MAG: DUF1156 domain-containing protein [Bacteroidota bacterium]
MPDRPDVLLEDWLPFETVGAESLRDQSAALKPPLNRIHVWWARRPLTVSRATIVASVLPPYDGLPERFRDRFPTEEKYQAWFLRLLGILGDPVAARKLIQADKAGKIKLTKNPYTHDRAFTVNPAPEDLALMRQILKETWGEERLTVMDPFSGGGSIPFEARRYGFNVVANELNPVACTILEGTLDFPFRFGKKLRAEIKKWGAEWVARSEKRLAPYFPKAAGENVQAYLWARTVACPTTGKPVPLTPNWWLGKDPDVAVKLLVRDDWEVPRFEIRSGADIDFDPTDGTVSYGTGRSPWKGDTIDGKHIKREAQAGRMGHMLYAVALKRSGGFDFRPPTDEDLDAIEKASAELARRRPRWEAEDVIPTEPIGISNYDRGHRLYGMENWADFFNDRQLLSLGTFSEVLAELKPEIQREVGGERARALLTYLAYVLDKAVIYNSVAGRLDPSRGIRSIFDKHNYSIVWSYGEFDAAANLLPWAVDQIADSYRDFVKLAPDADASLNGSGPLLGDLTLRKGSAADLTGVPDTSVHAVVTDPPYYDNVQYAELADFFYVWLKRTAGDLYPEWYGAQLTNKDDEAVANPARFADLGRKKGQLADRDYERKMADAFREAHRVLVDDGVLTVMFTHKKVEAWDTLATALIRSGFTVESSWPVHTESEHSLHQAKKNAAKSTILLACRKRQADGEAVWWEDIQAEVRRTARQTAEELSEAGVSGVDLYVATFGPVLSVISKSWPVLTSEIDEKTGDPLPLRPDTALSLAREEVVSLRKAGLLGGRDVAFDPLTDWTLMAWDAFQAARFPADEARKLALALNLEMEGDLVRHKIVTKKGKDVILAEPKTRRGKSAVNPEADTFDALVDAVHTAMLVYAEDGGAACEAFLKRTGLLRDGAFRSAVEAFVKAVPRVQKEGKFLRPEAAQLEALRAAFFPDIEPPEDPMEEVQAELFA